MEQWALERLKQLLSYNPDTGIFRWKVRRTRGHWGEPSSHQEIAGHVQNGYLKINIGPQCFYAHRLAWFYVHGVWPERLDHVNWLRADNRLSNLREASQSQNCANRKVHSNNKLQLKGVQRIEWRNSPAWRARLNGKHLGTFDNSEKAHAAYLSAASSKYGVFASPG